MTNLWLERNPLGPGSITDLIALITHPGSNLRSLDLDQTELGDNGVKRLFDSLSQHPAPLSLRNIYLNRVGISHAACTAISGFLAQPTCKLESIYLSNNPMGDKGAGKLAKGLCHNISLLRLNIASCGIKNDGAKAIFQALAIHPEIMTLDFSQHFVTDDLGARYNYLENDLSLKVALKELIRALMMRLLNLGVTAMTHQTMLDISENSVAQRSNLVSFTVKSIFPKANGIHGQDRERV